MRYLLIKKIFTNYKISKKIVSNKDKLFISIFFDRIREALKIKEEILTIFYSQTNK